MNSFKPLTPKSRDRVLTDPELAAIWNALEDDDYAKVIKLLVCTGCRRAEVGGMKWTEFSDDMSTWTLPKERAKNTKEHKLPVAPLMAEIVESISAPRSVRPPVWSETRVHRLVNRQTGAG